VTLLRSQQLPPGQFEAAAFIRFGLGRFLKKRIDKTLPLALAIRGDVANSIDVWDQLSALPRAEQTSDFHCVTTWSHRNLNWSGFRFSDFHRQLAVPLAKPQAAATLVVMRGSDGYGCALPLSDLLASDVMLADRLNGEPLGIAHGAPLRLVAPAHYGYKSVKHLIAIEYWTDRRNYSFPWPYPGFMDHPRARVAFEERARWVPNALLRPIYRLFVPAQIKGEKR
jgi:DMSO/TMAO reductase YedYZ molybdopterin-dependent catalytic subunit